jgi:hypothetical protein
MTLEMLRIALEFEVTIVSATTGYERCLRYSSRAGTQGECYSAS